MTIDQAQALCAVVDGGGYAKASNRLGKSHSALVYLIRELECHCGFRVFEPKTYRSTLTPQGRRVYQKCQEILQKVAELDQLCGQLKRNWEPSLKVVFDGILQFDRFLGLYQALRRERIPTVVQTYTDFLCDVEVTYSHLDADILIAIVPITSADIETIPLKPFKSILVAHRDHPVHQTTKRWELDQLREFSFLTIRASGGHLGLSTAEFEESASFFFSDFASKKLAIVKRLGFGWLPEHLIETELKNKTVQPVRWTRSSSQEIRPVLGFNRKRASGPAMRIVTQALGNF